MYWSIAPHFVHILFTQPWMKNPGLRFLENSGMSTEIVGPISQAYKRSYENFVLLFFYKFNYYVFQNIILFCIFWFNWNNYNDYKSNFYKVWLLPVKFRMNNDLNSITCEIKIVHSIFLLRSKSVILSQIWIPSSKAWDVYSSLKIDVQYRYKIREDILTE